MNRVERDKLARDLRTWALAYAAHGWPVFPLAPGTKIPALPKRLGGRGCLDATTDVGVVAAMWDRFPLGNVGIAAGEAAGLVVLDVDPRHGGDETLARLIERHGPLPSGPVARTPSGGKHYYFRFLPGLRCSAGQIGAGLDVRSTGGYVAAAPSVTPAGAYEWQVHPRVPLAVWPEWLVSVPRKIVSDAPIRALSSTYGRTLGDGEKVLAGLIRTVSEAPKGTRNGRLFWASLRLAEHAAAGRVRLDVGVAALLDAAERAGLPAREADRTLRSALSRAVVS